MALQPVSGIAPYSRNNINFNGRNNRNSDDSLQASRFSVPASVKAIPVAVLIAMSPLNEVNAVEASLPEPALTEITGSMPQKAPKILASHNIVDRKNGKAYYKVNKIDLDNDGSNYEALEVIKYSYKYANDVKPEVYERGLVTAGYLGMDERDKPIMNLSGVKLPTDDLTSYKPAPGLFNDLKKVDYNAGSLLELAIFMKNIALKDKANNGAFELYGNIMSENSEKNRELRSYFYNNY